MMASSDVIHWQVPATTSRTPPTQTNHFRRWYAYFVLDRRFYWSLQKTKNTPHTYKIHYLHKNKEDIDIRNTVLIKLEEFEGRPI